MRVLIVENNMDQAVSVSALLTINCGCDCFIATNVDQAFVTISQLAPDAILLDLLLDELKGVKVVEKFRRSHPRLPIVVMTGASDVDSEVLKAGGDGCLHKLDASPRKMFEAMSVAIEKHKRSSAMEKAISDVSESVQAISESGKKIEDLGKK